MDSNRISKTNVSVMVLLLFGADLLLGFSSEEHLSLGSRLRFSFAVKRCSAKNSCLNWEQSRVLLVLQLMLPVGERTGSVNC